MGAVALDTPRRSLSPYNSRDVLFLVHPPYLQTDELTSAGRQYTMQNICGNKVFTYGEHDQPGSV